MACDLHLSLLQVPTTISHQTYSLEIELEAGQEENTMNLLLRVVSRIVGSKRSQRGQTMTEYVLIIAAIAVAGYVAYQGLETGINGIITKVTASLNAA